LTGDNFVGDVLFTFFQLFTNASNHTDTSLQSVSSLFTDELVREKHVNQ
jgi:hypothetical protein